MKALSIIILLVSLVSCGQGNVAQAPQTPRQTMVIAEFSYMGALAVLNTAVSSGRLTGQTAADAAAAVRTTRAAMDAAQASVQRNDSNVATAVNAAMAALTNLTAIVERYRQ